MTPMITDFAQEQAWAIKHNVALKSPAVAGHPETYATVINSRINRIEVDSGATVKFTATASNGCTCYRFEYNGSRCSTCN